LTKKPTKRAQLWQPAPAPGLGPKTIQVLIRQLWTKNERSKEKKPDFLRNAKRNHSYNADQRSKTKDQRPKIKDQRTRGKDQ
jgi:predicted metal-dependent hydrolase